MIVANKTIALANGENIMIKSNRLKWRAFTSLLVLFSFVVLAFSGIILYIFPHGRVAYWVDFHLLGLDKDQWDTLHTCFSLLFVAFSVLHIVNNWRALWNYMRDKATDTFRMKKELISAFAISVAFVIGSIFFIPPFVNIKDLSEYIKESWVEPSEAELPFPHAELQSLESLGIRLGFDPDEAVRRLKEAGLDTKGSDETLKDIAHRNDTTPSAVLHKVAPELGWMGRGQGLGRGYGKGLRKNDGHGLGKSEGPFLGKGRYREIKKNDTEQEADAGHESIQESVESAGQGLGRGEGSGLGRGEGRGLGRGDGQGLGRSEGRGLGRGDGRGLGRGEGRGSGRGREQNADF